MKLLKEEMITEFNNKSTLFGYWRYEFKTKKNYFDANSRLILGLEEDTIFSLVEISEVALPEYIDELKIFWERVSNVRTNDVVNIKVKIDNDVKDLRIKASVDVDSINGTLEDISDRKANESINSIKGNLGKKIEKITKSGSFEWDLNEDFLVCSDNFFSICKVEGHNKNNKFAKNLFFELIEKAERNFVLDVIHESTTFNKEFEVSFHTSNSVKSKLKLYGYPYGTVKNKKVIAVVVDITNEIQHEEAVIKGMDIERKRLSLELHDSVGQKLIAVKYMLSLSKITQDFSKFNELNGTMDKIIEEIRSITHNLSTRIVIELGLKNAVSQLLNECSAAIKAEKKYIYEVPDDVIKSDDVAKMIYRIVQEALSNTMKYSAATEISVSIKHQNKQIIVVIIDNGKGFDISKVSVNNDGIGIQNIRQRVSFLNGFFRIESKKDFGTQIKIKIPIKK